jgi:hypothetical protein
MPDPIQKTPTISSSINISNSASPTRTTYKYHIHKKYVGFGIGSSFLLFYLLIVILVIVSSLEKNKELVKTKEELANFSTKTQILEQQLDTEKSAKATIERALDSVQKSTVFPEYFTISENTSARIGELFTPTNDLKFSKVAIKSNFAQGKAINVSIYAVADPEDLEQAVKIGETQLLAGFIKEDKEYILDFDQPLEIFADNYYFIVVTTTKDLTTKASIAYLNDDTVSEGILYKHSSSGWLSNPEQDLYYRFE